MATCVWSIEGWKRLNRSDRLASSVSNAAILFSITDSCWSAAPGSTAFMRSTACRNACSDPSRRVTASRATPVRRDTSLVATARSLAISSNDCSTSARCVIFRIWRPRSSSVPAVQAGFGWLSRSITAPMHTPLSFKSFGPCRQTGKCRFR